MEGWDVVDLPHLVGDAAIRAHQIEPVEGDGSQSNVDRVVRASSYLPFLGVGLIDCVVELEDM